MMPRARPGGERRDGEDVRGDVRRRGGNEATFAKDKPRVAAAFLRKANESSSKALDQGIGGRRGDVSHRSRVSNGGEV